MPLDGLSFSHTQTASSIKDQQAQATGKPTHAIR
jgi:hypothetical protein